VASCRRSSPATSASITSDRHGYSVKEIIDAAGPWWGDLSASRSVPAGPVIAEALRRPGEDSTRLGWRRAAPTLPRPSRARALVRSHPARYPD